MESSNNKASPQEREMAEIQIISKCNIYPKTAPILNSSTQRIDLTPWDLQLLLVNYNQKGLLFHKPKPHQNHNLEYTINLFKTSLACALDFFYLLARRLAQKHHLFLHQL
ncbi:hypothetical protein LguiB_031881 [Lonicera macranthoides]